MYSFKLLYSFNPIKYAFKKKNYQIIKLIKSISKKDPMI